MPILNMVLLSLVFTVANNMTMNDHRNHRVDITFFLIGDP